MASPSSGSPMKKSTESAFLKIPNREKPVELPIHDGSTGPKCLDVQKLYADSGFLTYDPGFSSTASCTSAITYIDGDKGDLLYRGYRIEELAQQSDFMEVAYLLIHGELPNETEKNDFCYIVTNHTMLHERLRNFYNGFRHDAHPMAIMTGVVGALSAFYHDSLNYHDPDQRDLACYRLIAKMPNIAALAFRYSLGRPFVYPTNALSYSENFLNMLFSLPSEPYVPSPTLARVMDMILILHADHEQNASTSTVRLASSSGANPFACIAAGIACLWGPAHGGANEAVINMLTEIGSKKNISTYIEKAKNKEDPFRLMGFGHRVYKNYDPRAAVLRSGCHDVLRELGCNDPLLELALELEEIALKDPYFIEKKLFPNVDFYSGIILKAMGFPTSMFTVLFAVARTVGWVAQWREMIQDPQQKIGRPRQLYTGRVERPFVPLGKRP